MSKRIIEIPKTLAVLGIKLKRDPKWLGGDDGYAWNGGRGSDEGFHVQFAPMSKNPRERWYVTWDTGDVGGIKRRQRGFAPEHYYFDLAGFGKTLELATKDLLKAHAALARRLNKQSKMSARLHLAHAQATSPRRKKK